MAIDKTCIICARKKSENEDLLFINGKEGCICEECVEGCIEVLNNYYEEDKNKEDESSAIAIKKPNEIKDFLDQYVIGQDAAKKKLAVAVYNHYKMLQYNESKNSDVDIRKSNVLLIGSTGSGKTYLLETLSKMLNIPFVIGDATSLTAAGYVGDDVENLVRNLLEAANYDIEKAQKGIIYIDEIDKLSRKGENVSITRDVGGEGVQQSILKMIEGTIVETPMTKGRKHPDAECVKIDTRNILFIVGGSFEGIEKVIQKRINKKNVSSIGFGGNVQSKKEYTLNDVIDEVTVEDLKKFGMIPELLGRLPVITTLKELDREALVRILTEPKDALVKQYQELFKLDGVTLEIKQDALEAIADLAIKRNVGARALRSIMEDTLSDLMFECPAEENLKKIVISKECITEKKKPKKLFNKPKAC